MTEVDFRQLRRQIGSLGQRELLSVARQLDWSVEPDAWDGEPRGDHRAERFHDDDSDATEDGDEETDFAGFGTGE